jgi:hypothetical protein
MLSRTATASLALPSAVSAVALRVQSHRSQLSASLGSKCPQYGHGTLSTSAMLAEGLVRPCTPRSFQSIFDSESFRHLKVTRSAKFVKQTSL